MSFLLPSFTSISNLDAGGSVTAIRTLFYIPATDPTATEMGGLVTALRDSTPSSTSASISASSDVGSGSISSVSGTTTASADPTSPSPKSTTSDDSTPIIYTPSSSSLSSSLSTFTSSNPTKPAIGSTPVPPPQSNRLANGTVAGIVIGVAIGLALITFLATLLAIRRRRGYVHVPSAKEFYKGLREKWGRWLSRQDESFEPDYTVQNKVEKDVAVRTIMEAERLGDMKVVCG